MHAYIIQQLIRIILFITISLPIGLKSFAQETKRFYMELDTPRNGAKAGQKQLKEQHHTKPVIQ